MILELILLAIGGSVLVYALGVVVLGWSTVTLGSVAGSIGLGSAWAYIVDYFSAYTAWMEKAINGESFAAALFMIGYIALVLVIAMNIIVTATDRKPGIQPLR